MEETTVTLVCTLPAVNLILMALASAAHRSREGPPTERFWGIIEDIIRQMHAGRQSERRTH